MGRSKFPAKPSKSLNRRRISILQVKAKCSNGRKTYDDADELGGSTSVLTNLIATCDSGKPDSGDVEEGVMCCEDYNITLPFKEKGKTLPGNQLQVISQQSLHEEINKNGSKKIFVNLVRMVNSALKNSEKVLATQSKTTMHDRDSESFTIFEKFELPCVEKNLSLKQKKTVTFKVHPESSDDNHRVNKKYHPFQKTPLVSIMKKESYNEAASKLNNQTIVKPSRLTEILKKKSRFDSLRSKIAKSKCSNSLESYFKYDDLRTLIDAGLETEYEDMVDNVFRQNKASEEVGKLNKNVLHDLMPLKEHQQGTNSDINFTKKFSDDQDQDQHFIVKSNDRKHQNQIMPDLLLGEENRKLTSQAQLKLNLMSTSNNFVLKQPRLGVTSSSLNETRSKQNFEEKLSLSLNMRGIRKKFQACEVCSTITSFKSVSYLRKYGAIACELCQKFISKINKKTMDAHFNMGSKIFRLHCKANNNCTITSIRKINFKTFKKIYKNRCSYCWLKRCIDIFRFPTGHKLRLKNILSSSTRKFNVDDEISKNDCIHNEKNKTKNGQKFSDAYVTTFAPNTFLSTSKQINWTNALKNILEGRHHFLVNSSNTKLSSISFKPISNALAENNLKFGATPYINPGTIEKFKCIQNGLWNYPQANICGSISKPGNIQSNLQLKRKQKDRCTKISKTMPTNSQKIFYAEFSNTSSFAEFSKRQKIDLKGPRVKHVCRSASIALGQQIATFSNEQSHINSLSILPYEEDPDSINCSLQMKQKKWSCAKNGNVAESYFRKSLLPLESTQLSSEVLLRLKIGANENFRQCIKEKQKCFNKSSIIQKGNVFCSNNPIKNIIKDFNHRFESQSKNQLKELPETIPKKIPTCLISIDFLQNYDPAEVSQNGFGLIITRSLPVRALCFLCGSAGCNALLFCACCCEPYHQHCVEDEYSLEHVILNKKIFTDTKTKDQFNWICPRCTVCSNCNMSSGSKVKCQKCQKNYHSTCLGTSKRLLGADRPLICANCLNCKVCYTTNVSKFVGNLPMCLQCFKLKKKGNRCSVCQISCEANDFDLKIIECRNCQQWMHYKCERLSEEQYNLLSSLPECIHFICQKCSEKSELSKKRSREWRAAISEEFKAKLCKIVKSLSKTRQASVLLQYSHRKKRKIRYCSCSIEENYSDFKDKDNTAFYNTQCKLCKIKDVKATDISKEIFCNKNDCEKRTCSLNLIDVKKKVCGGEYVTLSEFNYDMCNIIESQNCDELIIAYKEILSEQFPWFQNDTKACTNALEEDMFDPCVYLSCEETMNIEQETQVRFPDHITEPLLLFKVKEDTRTCISCGKQGDGAPNKESRLLYYGHDCWVHVNCAIWASDVFEEVDGSLQNVQQAVIRGRSILCSICGNRGATIKCKVQNCEEFYHYPCAQSNNCYFTTEKSFYCQTHALENENIELLQTTNFDVQRPVYVELENKRKHFFDSSKVQFHIGSLVVKQLGVIHPKYSDSYEVIVPINFVCSRLYWSCKEPWKIVEYTLKTSLQNNTPSCKYDAEINFTVDHSESNGAVQLGLSQISLWHKSLISKENLDAEYKYSTCDSASTVKPKIGTERFKCSAIYEDSIEEEQQTNTDLLPPEIKDVIFDDLPHEILDGISMVDIFPKLMIYDDMITIESKSDVEEDLSNPVCIELDRNTKRKVCHSEDVVPVPLYKNNKDTNKNREFFSKNLKTSYLQNNFHWNRKIENNLALKKWKVSKNLQNNRGCDNARTNFYHQQQDNLPKSLFNMNNMKTTWCESVGKPKEKKLMQLDGIDDFVPKQSLNTANSTINTECDHCHSISRNNELYNPHTLTCGSFVTNKNECKVATRCSAAPCSVYLKRNDMSQIFLESEIPCIQNIPFTLNTGILETHITNLNQTQYPDLFSYETPLIENKTDTSIQIANAEFFIHKPFLTSHAGQYYPNCSNVTESQCPNISSNLSIDMGSCPPISLQTAQPVAFNIPNTSTYQIPQIITLASDQDIQMPETYNKLQNDVNKSIGCYHWTSPNDTREQTLKNCKPRFAKQKINADIAISNTELFTRHESQSLYQTEFTAVADLSNKQILSETSHICSTEEKMESNSFLLPSNSSQPTLLIRQSPISQNISNDVSPKPIHYGSIPVHECFKSEPLKTIMTASNAKIGNSFIPGDYSNNATSGLQSFSGVPIIITQYPQNEVIGTIIQPQNFQSNLLWHDQVVENGVEVITNPQMTLVSQPSYYGLETIVHNTVMSSQQFVSTAIQSILSQNASYSATTTQVFQASKVEPFSGYVIMSNPVDDSSLSQEQENRVLYVTGNAIQSTTPHSENVHYFQNFLGNEQNFAQFSYQNEMHSQLNTKANMNSINMSVDKNDKSIINDFPTKLTQQIFNNFENHPILPSQNKIYLSDSESLNADLKNEVGLAKIIAPSPAERCATLYETQGSADNFKVSPSSAVKHTTKGSYLSTSTCEIRMKTKKPLNNVDFVSNQDSDKQREKFKEKTSVKIKSCPSKNDNKSRKKVLYKKNKSSEFQGVVPQQNKYLRKPEAVKAELVKVGRKKGLILCKSSSQAKGNQFHHNISVCYSNSNLQNIPTNVVSPIQHPTTSLSISRPTNRVLPMQSITSINESYKQTSKPISKSNSNKYSVPAKTPKCTEQKSGNEKQPFPFSLELKQQNDACNNFEQTTLNTDESKSYGNAILTEEETYKRKGCVGVPKLTNNLPKIHLVGQLKPLYKNSDCIADRQEFVNETLRDEDNISKQASNNSDNTIAELHKIMDKIVDVDKDVNGFFKESAPQVLKENPQSGLQRSLLNLNKLNGDNLNLEPYLLYEIRSDDGFVCESSSITEIWEKIFKSVQLARRVYGLRPLPDGSLADMCGVQAIGLKTNALKYLIEQLPGVEQCVKYTPKYHKRDSGAYNTPCNTRYMPNQDDIDGSLYGCGKCQPYSKRSDYDMFSWLASKHRKQPAKMCVQLNESELLRRGTGSNLPMAMKYRTLKETYKGYVGVFRSYIHGRGLYCTKDIESGEMVIEYAGELIRSTLTDKRERKYDSRGIGCYMFKIDDHLVVDATMKGNAARFINHSCEPNCYSKVVDIFGHKHIIIFTLRRIIQGEELTYDYKFPFEEEKIPCSCGSKKCRKYLN